MLYLIEILHQTTTLRCVISMASSCILSKFYIKPQLCDVPYWCDLSCILSKFYIKPQQCAPGIHFFIVVSYRNSTSNHNVEAVEGEAGPVVSYRNSTSNHNGSGSLPVPRKVVSYRNSTSNHNQWQSDLAQLTVVSYRNSTSNHNSGDRMGGTLVVVSYRNSTSNHNTSPRARLLHVLYLIEILHQTTTPAVATNNL